MGNDESLPILEPNQHSLNLRNKKLTSFPVRIPADHPIESIDISYNKIPAIPPNLTFLHYLDYSNNDIGTISPYIEGAIKTYINLAELNLSSNSIENVPSSFCALKSLRMLSLNHNKIKTFTLKNPSLQILDLSCNLLTSFKAVTDTMTSLNLGFNRLSKIEFSSSSLHELNLPGNDFTSFPEKISFESLAILDISYNKLTFLPDISKISPQLEELNFSFNEISTFPDPLPISIVCINASHNKITELPSLIKYSFLKTLHIAENLIKSLPQLPQSLVEVSFEKNRIESSASITLMHIQKLFMNHNILSEVPRFTNSSAVFFSASNNQINSIKINNIAQTIVRLDLSCNNIENIPADLFTLPELKQLFLFRNNISEIPKEIASSSISMLNISSNPISSLPNMPKALTLISAQDCDFKTFPDSLSDLPNLLCVDFSNNKIDSFPEISKLETIMLSCNCITDFPNLSSCVKYVDLSHNHISSASLCSAFRNLVEFDISHNNLKEFECNETISSLITLKMSHNKGLSLVFSFKYFPSLDCLDISHTNVEINSQEPAKKMRELIKSKSYSINPMMKIFSDENAGYAEMKGNRVAMEDALIIRHLPHFDVYGVIDGHAGFNTSTWAAFKLPQLIDKFETNVLVRAIRTFNSFLETQNVTDGATLALVLIHRNKMIAVNIGDSRTIIVRRDGSTCALSYDHKPYEREELEEIRTRGEFVSDNRTSGKLSISRALGDFFLNGVSAIPNIKEYNVEENDYRVVIACDGVFDVLTNDDVGKIVCSEDDPSIAAYKVRNCAYSNLSDDNISVIVIDLNRQD